MIGMGSSGSKGKRDCTLDSRATREFRRRIDTPPHRIRVMRELMLANRSKVGAPFRHPDCIIEWVMRVKAKNKSFYRDVVGDVEDRLLALGLPPLSHSQLYERSRALFESAVRTTDVCDARVLAFGSFPAEGGKDVTAALDASGFSLNNYGGWIFHKWNMEPVTGWVKLHAMIDVGSQMLLSYVVTDESCGDQSCFSRLVELAVQAGHRVTRLLADAAYDMLDNWRLCRSFTSISWSTSAAPSSGSTCGTGACARTVYRRGRRISAGSGRSVVRHGRRRSDIPGDGASKARSQTSSAGSGT